MVEAMGSPETGGQDGAMGGGRGSNAWPGGRFDRVMRALTKCCFVGLAVTLFLVALTPQWAVQSIPTTNGTVYRVYPWLSYPLWVMACALPLLMVYRFVWMWVVRWEDATGLIFITLLGGPILMACLWLVGIGPASLLFFALEVNDNFIETRTYEFRPLGLPEWTTARSNVSQVTSVELGVGGGSVTIDAPVRLSDTPSTRGIWAKATPEIIRVAKKSNITVRDDRLPAR